MRICQIKTLQTLTFYWICCKICVSLTAILLLNMFTVHFSLKFCLKPFTVGIFNSNVTYCLPDFPRYNVIFYCLLKTLCLFFLLACWRFHELWWHLFTPRLFLCRHQQIKSGKMKSTQKKLKSSRSGWCLLSVGLM